MSCHLVGIPFAIQQCGLVLGIILLVFVTYLVRHSVIMLINCGIKCQKYDFEMLSEHLLGRYGYYTAVVFMFLFAYGAQIAYLVIIADTIPLASKLLFPSSFLCDRSSALLFIATIIVLPICLLRNLSALSWTSFLSVLADVVILVIIVATCRSGYFDQSRHFEEHDLDDRLHSTLFTGIGKTDSS